MAYSIKYWKIVYSRTRTNPPEGFIVTALDFDFVSFSVLKDNGSAPSVIRVAFFLPNTEKSNVISFGEFSVLIPAIYHFEPLFLARTTYLPGNPSMNFTSSHCAGRSRKNC